MYDYTVETNNTMEEAIHSLEESLVKEQYGCAGTTV